MSSNPSTQASDAAPQATPEKVYVQIPKAGPGQHYEAPKNYQQPTLLALGRALVFLLCLSLPVVPGGLIILLLATDQNARDNLLWLFLPLGVFVVAIALFVAIGIWREADGSAGGDWYERVPR
jgi:hypothetical protein